VRKLAAVSYQRSDAGAVNRCSGCGGGQFRRRRQVARAGLLTIGADALSSVTVVIGNPK